ncbi:transposase domain-containing protein [Dyadobacter bucti]|uniref:transposase domain-containing protein n=1 Tax=Dyadobacter bucti TaxID=2572203 RepID=UPI003F6F70D1
MYTFADQCKRHNQDPHQWLKHVFENILDTKPSQYHSLLPQNYIAQDFDCRALSCFFPVFSAKPGSWTDHFCLIPPMKTCPQIHAC